MKFVFDIDDTILFSEVDEKGEYVFKGHNWHLVAKINELYERNDEIILWTGRHWNHLNLTIKQLQAINIKYHTLIMGKPPVDYYIDDKALTPEEFLEKVI